MVYQAQTQLLRRHVYAGHVVHAKGTCFSRMRGTLLPFLPPFALLYCTLSVVVVGAPCVVLKPETVEVGWPFATSWLLKAASKLPSADCETSSCTSLTVAAVDRTFCTKYVICVFVGVPACSRRPFTVVALVPLSELTKTVGTGAAAPTTPEARLVTT